MVDSILPFKHGSMFMALHVQIPLLQGFTFLERLELSYNQIQSLLPLQSLNSTALGELYVANNAVTAIEVRAQLCYSAERPAIACRLLHQRAPVEFQASYFFMGSLVRSTR